MVEDDNDSAWETNEDQNNPRLIARKKLDALRNMEEFSDDEGNINQERLDQML